MALVLRPCQIRATDLERIPREGSLSTDPRDLPVQPRLKPTATVARTALLAAAVLARPGLKTGPDIAKVAEPTTPPAAELECYPLEVKDGKDVIVTDGSGGGVISLAALLGLRGGLGATKEEKAQTLGVSPDVIQAIGAAVAALISALWTIVIWRAGRMLLFRYTPELKDFTTLFYILLFAVMAASGATAYFTQ
jgi:hypothetical protein